jgi:hypothetical protein
MRHNGRVMRTRLRHFCMAFWLGLLALAANGLEQQQLNTNVLVALSTDLAAGHGGASGTHVMPDGTVMAGTMADDHAARGAGGHTHKGHADCEVCGAVAAMAAITLPILPCVPLPTPQYQAGASAAFTAATLAEPYPPYASRAPPSLTA